MGGGGESNVRKFVYLFRNSRDFFCFSVNVSQRTGDPSVTGRSLVYFEIFRRSNPDRRDETFPSCALILFFPDDAGQMHFGVVVGGRRRRARPRRASFPPKRTEGKMASGPCADDEEREQNS